MPNLNQDQDIRDVLDQVEEGEEEDGDGTKAEPKQKRKKAKQLSKSFWNLFSPSSSSKEKAARRSGSTVSEKFVVLPEETEVDASPEDSLEDVKKVRQDSRFCTNVSNYYSVYRVGRQL